MSNKYPQMFVDLYDYSSYCYVCVYMHQYEHPLHSVCLHLEMSNSHPRIAQLQNTEAASYRLHCIESPFSWKDSTHHLVLILNTFDILSVFCNTFIASTFLELQTSFDKGVVIEKSSIFYVNEPETINIWYLNRVIFNSP